MCALLTPPAFATDYNSVCAGVTQSGQAGQGGTNNEQKVHYCEAAKAAQEGADADSTLWKVWAAVATVCGVACANIYQIDQIYCSGSNLAAGVTDALITKNYMGALTAAGTSAGAYMLSKKEAPTSAPSAAPTDAKKDRDWGSCMIAASAAMQAFSKNSSMKSQEESVKSNLESAQALNSDAASVAQNSSASLPGSGSTDSSGSSGSSDGSSVQSKTNETESSSAQESQGPCSRSAFNDTGNYQGLVACAVARDRSLPSFVSSPRFARDFKKVAGMELSDFFAKSESHENQGPGPAMAGAMGGSLSPTHTQQVAAALRSMQDKVQFNSPNASSTYASSSGGSHDSAGSDDMNSMMAKIMEQFMPKDGQEGGETATGLSAVAFANRKRSPASIAEDRSLNIFDRITYRYYFVSQRVIR